MRDKPLTELGSLSSYINSDGNLSKGWHKVDNTWYYFGDDYKAVTGQQVINGKTYYFDASGKWIK